MRRWEGRCEERNEYGRESKEGGREARRILGEEEEEEELGRKGRGDARG